MDGKELIAWLKRKHGLKSNAHIAKHLGMTAIQVAKWEKQKSPLTPVQIGNAIEKSSKVAVVRSQGHQIKPIAEFFSITSVESQRGANFVLFPAGKEDNPLHQGLRKALNESNGIYIFYDTRGQAIYAGKAKKQLLWSEMNNAFNRDRATQTLYRVNHPQRKQAFHPAHTNPRQIRPAQVRLNEMAAYFSAYAIDLAMIDSL